MNFGTIVGKFSVSMFLFLDTQLASTSPGSCSINIVYAEQDFEEVVYPILVS